MTFQPVIPLGGNAGWSFLTRTRAAQEEAFRASAVNQRETDYFRQNIGNITTAEELVGDRRLLAVALGAFGLGDDIGNTFFIRKVLEEGTADEASFANRLGDKRYFRMAEAFGFDLAPPNTLKGTFADQTIDSYLAQQFEVSVGNSDPDLRLALGLDRELETVANRELSEPAQWFTILGTPPLRRVFETALGLPAAIAGVDIDRQLEIFREKSQKQFGTANPSDFLVPDLQEQLIRRFFLQTEVLNAPTGITRGSVALSLLQAQSPVL